MKKIALVLIGLFICSTAMADVLHKVVKDNGLYRIKYKHVLKDIDGKDRWMLSESQLKTPVDIDSQIARWIQKRNYAIKMIKRFEDEKTAINAIP